MAAERIRRFLEEQRLTFELHEHPREVSAQRLAAAEHVSGWLIAKPVLLWAGGRLIMAVLPGALEVDLEKVKVVLGVAGARLATEAEFADVFTDCEVGAEPPFGNLYDVPVYADSRLLQVGTLVCRAGDHVTSFEIDTADYVRTVGPIEVDIATAT